MILINRTYSEVTPESSEDGEFSDSGFIAENEECTFRELVAYMREHSESSCSPACGATYEWYSSGFDIEDYVTGAERQTSIHYSADNPARKAKYWKLAAQFADIL